ncbi:hypothetical protein Tco_0688355 [Tanacetum coccineum]
MTKQQLIEEYEYICKRLEKDRLLSAQYNLFRPKPVISEPPSKRQRVDRGTSPPSGVPAATTQPADDPDSAGGGTSHPAGSTFGAPVSDSTVPTPAAMDSAGSHHESGVSPFADSADRGINEFFLTSDAEEQIGLSRVAVDPDSDDEVLAEILFRGKYISGAGVVDVDKLPDDEIVDPRVKRLKPFLASAAFPLGLFRSESESRWGAPGPGGDDGHGNLYSSSSYGHFKDWGDSALPGSPFFCVEGMNRYFANPDVDVGLRSLEDVNCVCQSLHSDDVEDFWRTQDEWIMSSWQLYPKSSVHVLDLTNGKTVYMFVDKVYPIRATLLERMLRHRLTVPPSYCRDVVVAGNIIQTVQDGLRQAYECLASAPIIVLYKFGVSACTARQMVFSSPWLTAKKESGSPLQTALVCNSNPLIALASPEQTATGKDMSNPLHGCDSLPKTVRVFQFTLDSRSEKLDWFLLHQDWKLLFFDDATSFDSVVHRVHVVSFDAAVLDAAAPVSAACIIAAGYIVSAGIYDAAGSSVLAVFINICCILCFCCHSILLLREDLSRNLELTESKPIVPAGSSSSVPADYVSAGHVLVSADRDRIC